MRRHDFGKNPLPARAMEEDTFPFARAPKNATSCPPPEEVGHASYLHARSHDIEIAKSPAH